MSAIEAEPTDRRQSQYGHRAAAGLGFCRVSPPGEVVRALGSTPLAVAAARGHCESISGPIGPLASLGGNRHRPFEDEETGIEFVRVFGVENIGFHAAIHDLGIALLAQFALECHPIICFLPDLGL